MTAAASHRAALGRRSRAGVVAWEWAAVLLITALGAALRLYRLPDLPPGLHFDEAFKGVTARSLLEGAPLRIFFESDMGEEPLAIYLVAASLSLFGSDSWLIRLPSAIAGILAIPATWWLGRELVRAVYRRRVGDARPLAAGPGVAGMAGGGAGAAAAERFVGLGAALVLAILYWHVSFSRIGMEPILVPLFLAVALAALLRGVNTGGRAAFVVAGVATGGSVYTYKAGYLVPVVVALSLGVAAAGKSGWVRRYRSGLALMAVAALVVAAPLGVYFAGHPANLLERPASVAVGGGEGGSAWLEAWHNLPCVLGLFFVRGDANPRSNLPGRPALDPFLAALFLVGAGWSVAHIRRPAASLPLLWLGVMVVPTLLTGDAPHFGRAIGATPALAVLCALGGWTAWRAAARWRPGGLRVATGVGLAAGLAFAGASTARDYFVTWAGSPDLFYAYDVGLAEVAAQMARVPAGEAVYLTPTAGDHFTLQYLVDRPVGSFDGRAGLVLPPPARAATVFVLVQEDGATAQALGTMWPDGEVAWTAEDPWSRVYAVAYHLPAVAATALPAAGAQAPGGRFRPAAFEFGPAEDGIRLAGYALDAETMRPGGEVAVTLYWEAQGSVAADYTAFVHLLGAYNPETGGPVWAGHDGQPDGGRYPTGAWQPGELVLDVHRVAVPANTPAGAYRIEVGLYLLATLERLPAWDGAGRRLVESGDAAVVGTVGVE